MASQNLSSTTQQYLDIFDITNDLVLMKNGTTSLILSVDAMNFGLLAEEEQDSIIYAYAGLLNSLNYSVQILIRSQTKDVTSYLQKLKDQEDHADSRENQTRIRRYREFVSNLIHERNVLDKKFFVIIPASPLELGLMPVKSVIPGQQEFDISTVERSLVLEKAKNLLEPKRDHLTVQFSRIGLYSYQLTTQEIIQLFYLSYNPEASEGQQIAESHSYSTPLVKASFEGIPMFSTQASDDQQVINPQGTVPDAGGDGLGEPSGLGGASEAVAPHIQTPQQPAPVVQNLESPVLESPALEPSVPAVEAPAAEAPMEIPGFELANHPQVAASTTQTLPGTDLPSTEDNAVIQDEINKTLGQIGSVPPSDMSVSSMDSEPSLGMIPPSNPTMIDGSKSMDDE